MKSKSAKIVATASPAIAVEPNNSHESDIQVFSAFDQFANVFPDVDDTVAAQSADHAAPSTQTGGSADYTYTITVDPLTKTGTASVDLALNIGEHVYPLTVSGDVKNVSIREDIEMVTGILCGSVDIAGKTYAVEHRPVSCAAGLQYQPGVKFDSACHRHFCYDRRYCRGLLWLCNSPCKR